MKKRWILLILLAGLLLSACSAASVGRTFDYGTPKLIISNGGVCVNKIAISEGRVEDVANGDGWNFTDLRSGALTQVGGDVIIIDATDAQVRAYSTPEGEAAATAALLLQVQEDGTIPWQSATCAPSPTPEPQ